MPSTNHNARRVPSFESGLTLIELIIVCAIMGILASAAMPMARVIVKRQKEQELRIDLREMRNAIDAYKDAADRGLIRTEVDTFNYPPDLQTLVDGVDLNSGGASAIGGAAPVDRRPRRIHGLHRDAQPRRQLVLFQFQCRLRARLGYHARPLSAKDPHRSDDRQSRLGHALRSRRSRFKRLGRPGRFRCVLAADGTGLDGTKYSDW